MCCTNVIPLFRGGTDTLSGGLQQCVKDGSPLEADKLENVVAKVVEVLHRDGGLVVC